MQREETRAAATELRVGEVFGDHRIEGIVGGGGMGVVYRATDLRLDRTVALKVIRSTLSADEDFRRRFERESQTAASIVQPNVVTIYQAGEAGGLLFVTMELVDGIDLRAYIGRRGRLDLQSTGAIAAQVALALDAAHARGLVHRDVKPANVLVANRTPLHVYLTDFGLTKRASSQTGLTKTGLFVGTIDYAAPEQIQGWPVDARADVYAFGCVLFEMVTGQPPFRRENEYATMYAHITEPPPAPSAAAPGTPPALDGVLARALAKDPDARYPSAGDLARAVDAALSGRAPSEPERTVAVGRAAGAAPPTAMPAGVPTALPQPQAPPQAQATYLYPPQAPLPAQPPAQVPPPSYPTSVLPAPRRNWLPALVVALAVLVAGGAVAAILLGRDDSSPTPVDPGVQQQPTQTPSEPQQPTTPPADAALRRGTRQIGALLDLSAEGRALTASGDFAAAAANRTEILTRLGALSLPPQLRRSGALLRAAMQASLQSDLTHQAGTDAGPVDARATALKARFVSAFNPFAQKYLERSFDPGQL